MLNDLLSLALAAGIPGQEFPPNATLADQVFAYGSIVVMVVMILWNVRNDSDPPRQ